MDFVFRIFQCNLQSKGMLSLQAALFIAITQHQGLQTAIPISIVLTVYIPQTKGKMRPGYTLTLAESLAYNLSSSGIEMTVSVLLVLNLFIIFLFFSFSFLFHLNDNFIQEKKTVFMNEIPVFRFLKHEKVTQLVDLQK